MSFLSPVRVAPGSGRYFETFDGESFLFVGVNDSVTWPGLAPLYRRRDVPAVERYLDDIAAEGVNTLRLMLEYAQTSVRFFEKPVGRFNPPMVRLWDDLFAMCRARGLRILLTPWDTFWMGRKWHNHPYNARNGGPAHEMSDMLTSEAAIAATLARLRFVTERWGEDGTLVGWDLFNEIDPCWGGDVARQSATLSRVSHALREIETAKWGFSRLQTVSVFGAELRAEYEDMIFRHPDLDFATTHVYKRGPLDFPENSAETASEFGELVRQHVRATPTNRPYTDSEHGPIHLFNDHNRWLPEAQDDELERRVMWAHLAAGGAGSGMRWPYRHPHSITPGMFRDLGGLRAFSKLLDWRTFRPEDAGVDLPDSPLLPGARYRFVIKDRAQALVYLIREPMATGPRAFPICLRLLQPGAYRLFVWDIAAGRPFGEAGVVVCSDGVLQITLWTPVGDCAIAVCRTSDR